MTTNITIHRDKFPGICLASEHIYSCSQATSEINRSNSFESSETHEASFLLKPNLGFAGGAVVGNLPANAGDTGLSPGLGRSHMPRSN